MMAHHTLLCVLATRHRAKFVMFYEEEWRSLAVTNSGRWLHDMRGYRGHWSVAVALVCIFIARRYASAAYAVVVCRSVSLSVTNRYQNDWTNRAGFWHRGFILTLFYKEIWVSPQIRVLPSGILSQTPKLENFTTAIRLCCQRNSSTTPTTVYTSWLFTARQSTVTLRLYILGRVIITMAMVDVDGSCQF